MMDPATLRDRRNPVKHVAGTSHRLVAAIVDRITFNAHIIETGTQSYRLATSKASNRKRAS